MPPSDIVSSANTASPLADDAYSTNRKHKNNTDLFKTKIRSMCFIFFV